MTGVESRQFVCSITDDGYAFCLQIFERQTQIQDGLSSGTDDHDLGLCEFLQVGGDVEGLLRSAVYASDTAGSKHFDTRQGSNDHRGGYGGSAVFTARQEYREVATGRFDDCLTFLTQVFNFLFGATGFQFAADDSDSSRNGSVIADRLLHAQCRLHVLRIRHAVTDDG